MKLLFKKLYWWIINKKWCLFCHKMTNHTRGDWSLDMEYCKKCNQSRQLNKHISNWISNS